MQKNFQAVPFKEVDVPELTEERKYELEKHTADVQKLFDQSVKGRYKIDVFFREVQTVNGLRTGMLQVFENGTKLNGDGDAKVYFCPGDKLRGSGCQGVIPYDSTGYGFLVCPSCVTTWKEEEVYGEILANWFPQGWADQIERTFRQLGSSADIYVKYPRFSLQKASEQEQEKELRGDKLNAVRSARKRVIYPLRNILQDTSAGADLNKRILAFLKA